METTLFAPIVTGINPKLCVISITDLEKNYGSRYKTRRLTKSIKEEPNLPVDFDFHVKRYWSCCKKNAFGRCANDHQWHHWIKTPFAIHNLNLKNQI